jgi:hypothetical protein
MAELTLTSFLTLDGVMQAPGGPGEDPSGGFPHEGWLVPHADPDMGRTMVEILSKADAFLHHEYGRCRQCLPSRRTAQNRLVRA